MAAILTCLVCPADYSFVATTVWSQQLEPAYSKPETERPNGHTTVCGE